MNKVIRIGSRTSKLALKQVDEFKQLYPCLNFEVMKIDTLGDKDKQTPLSCVENTDFFTREIELALLAGDVDIALHSAKDLEEDTPDDLHVVLITSSISIFDCLISRSGLSLETLPINSVIGTSSCNRANAIRAYIDDFYVKDIRGNVDERILSLDEGNYDAIIVAHAALIRLGLEDRISEILSIDIIQPHPLQGCLAVQIRKDRTDLISVFGGN